MVLLSGVGPPTYCDYESFIQSLGSSDPTGFLSCAARVCRDSVRSSAANKRPNRPRTVATGRRTKKKAPDRDIQPGAFRRWLLCRRSAERLALYFVMSNTR